MPTFISIKKYFYSYEQGIFLKLDHSKTSYKFVKKVNGSGIQVSGFGYLLYSDVHNEMVKYFNGSKCTFDKADNSFLIWVSNGPTILG